MHSTINISETVWHSRYICACIENGFLNRIHTICYIIAIYAMEHANILGIVSTVKLVYSGHLWAKISLTIFNRDNELITKIPMDIDT